MKLKLMVVAALAACSAVAMPTNDELEKANKEVQASLKTQIAAWQSGDLSDGDLAALMLMHAGKFKDEARRYAKRLGIPANTASKIKRRIEARIFAILKMYE